MNLLEIHNMKKTFGDLEVLKDISLSVKEGEVVSIIGPSGSGKSTLLRCATMLEEMDGGTLSYLGQNAAWEEEKDGKAKLVYAPKKELRMICKNFGLVFQSFHLFPHYTVLKNIIDAPVNVDKVPKNEAIERAEKLLEQLGLSDKRDEYPRKLSGGQKQRISIARVFVKNPPVVILDEATSALDNESEQYIKKSLAELTKGRTTFTIAHRLSTVRNATRIIVLTEKGIEEQGTHGELMSKENGIYRRLNENEQ